MSFPFDEQFATLNGHAVAHPDLHGVDRLIGPRIDLHARAIVTQKKDLVIARIDLLSPA